MDTWLEQKLQLASSGTDLAWQIKDGVLCKLVGDTFCPVLPDSDDDLIRIVLEDYHSSALGGHLGPKKLLKLVQKHFYFLNMN